MATLTVRNLDDAIMAKLKARAKINNRSMEAEVRQILGLAATGPTTETLIARADTIAAMTPDHAPQTDSVDLLRKDRER